MTTHRFKIKVNCFISNENESTDALQDTEDIHEDYGFIILPDGYSDQGKPTRLVINCHGAGGTVTTDDSQVEHQALTKYLVANGYAVMDVNGLPTTYANEHGIDLRNNVGSPIALRCYVKGYHYCISRFNLYGQVFVHGGSMGGISSTNLVLSGTVPVIAHSAFCPVLDTYNEIFLNPWSKGLPKTALGKIYRFATDENGDYIYDESRLSGFNPARNAKARCYPVPLKFWQCKDDGVVSYEVTKKFVDAIRENGGNASLRTFNYGGHEPQLVGEAIKNTVGISVLGDEQLEITPAVEETFIWIRNFDMA